MQATEMLRSPGDAVVERDDAAPVHAPRHVVLGLAGGDAAVALDAALGVADELHSCHRVLPQAVARSIWQTVVFVSCIIVTLS